MIVNYNLTCGNFRMHNFGCIVCSIKMTQKGISFVFIKVLLFWYDHLQCAVLWKSVLDESFRISCGVRQGGVLSPYLFSPYTDDVIRTLRKSGYGIYVGNIFTGCILYADDIILLSCSYCGLQKMVNICSEYGVHWDIKFNPTKSRCISFGAVRQPPSPFTVMLNDTVVNWADKAKYLGCYFNQTCA